VAELVECAWKNNEGENEAEGSGAVGIKIVPKEPGKQKPAQGQQ
jgi:hypothetical protein